MTTQTVAAPGALPRILELRADNWVLAFIIALIISIAAMAWLPPAASFWVALAAWILAAASAVYNAWGRYIGGLLVAPAIALLFLMNIFPLMWSLGLSFFSYRANRARAPVFVGFENYANILTDPVVWQRLQTTAVLVIATVSVQMVVGFLLAFLFAKQFPLRRYLLILVLTPMMLSYVAVGAFFRYYYEPTFGLLSQFVRMFTGEPYILMQSTEGAMAGIIFADAWMWAPFVMLLVLAGLVSVPKYLYEAAAIDRASFWRRFTSITFPYIRGLLMLALLFRTIEAFKLFDIVFLLTEGGPGASTETISIYLFRQAIQFNRTSDATTISYILLFTVIVLTNLYLYFVNRRARETQ